MPRVIVNPQLPVTLQPERHARLHWGAPSMKLPILRQAPVQQRGATAATAPAPLVSVVEDDPSIAGLSVEILALEGLRVRHVDDGQAAVATVKQTPPALILMDLMLLVMGGVDAFHVICQIDQPAVAGVPIIAMSAGVNLRASAAWLPVEGVLAKPSDIDELLALVQIQRRKAHDDG